MEVTNLHWDDEITDTTSPVTSHVTEQGTLVTATADTTTFHYADGSVQSFPTPQAMDEPEGRI